MKQQGRHVSLWRRVLRVDPRPTWHDRHPLPEGWRPRTRIDELGRVVEPWAYSVLVGGDLFDGGEWWLPVGLDPDQAAWTVLEYWMATTAPECGLTGRDLARLRVAATRAAVNGTVFGMAYALDMGSHLLMRSR